MTMPRLNARSRSVFFAALVCALPAAASLVGCMTERKGNVTGSASAGSAGGAGASAAGGLMKVAAVKVEKKTLVRTMEQPGQIVPLETTPLVAKVPGYVHEIKKDIGDAVEAGEPLAVLSAPELQDDVNQKAALVKQAESGITQAQAGLKVADAAVVKAKAAESELQSGVDRAVAEQTRWDSELKRMKELQAQGSVTVKLVDETQNKRDAAAASLAEAKAKFQSAAATIAEAEARVVQAKADLEAAKAQKAVAMAAHAAAEQMTHYLSITSPYKGMVTERHVDTGHFVSPATSAAGKPLFVVVRADRVRVVVGVPENDAQFINAGDPAVVKVFALGDRSYSAGVSVTRTALTLDRDSGTLRAEIDMDNAKGELRPGLYVNVTIELDRRADAAAVPTSALFQKDGKPACVAIVDGKTQTRFVTKGITAGAEVEILPSDKPGEGLRPGDVVVAKNPATLVDGQAVEAVLPPPAK